MWRLTATEPFSFSSPYCFYFCWGCFLATLLLVLLIPIQNSVSLGLAFACVVALLPNLCTPVSDSEIIKFFNVTALNTYAAHTQRKKKNCFRSELSILLLLTKLAFSESIYSVFSYDSRLTNRRRKSPAVRPRDVHYLLPV